MKKYKILLYSGILLIISAFVVLLLNNNGTKLDLYGDSKITLYQYKEYKEPGYIALKEDNILSNEVEIESDLDTNTIGEYIIKYKIDNVIKERIVKVIEEPLSNINLKLKGKEIVNIEQYSLYNESGYTCTKSGKDCSKKVKKINEIDTQKEGSYKVKYYIEENGERKEVVRIVNVIKEEYFEKQLAFLDNVKVDDKKTETKKEDTSKNKKLKVNLTSNKTNIHVIVTGNNFDYCINPDNTIEYSKEYDYIVNKNGTYKFECLDKNSDKYSNSIKITSFTTDAKIFSLTYDNNNKLIKVNVKGYSMGYVVNPDNTKSTKTSYNFLIENSGTYKFVLHDKNEKTYEKTIDVNVTGASQSTKYNLNANITIANKEPTNKSVNINVSIEGKNYSYTLISGKKYTAKEFVYTVTSNGIYTFKVYDTNNNYKNYSIKVDNINNTVPTLKSCTCIVKGNKTTINIDTNDTELVQVLLNDSETFTFKKSITLSKALEVSKIRLVDKFNNSKVFSCNVTRKKISELSISQNTTAQAQSVDITVVSTGDDFSYVKNPDGSTNSSNKYTYRVTKNGTYTFTLYDTDGSTVQKSLSINNIFDPTSVKAQSLTLNGLKAINTSTANYLLYLCAGTSYTFNYSISPSDTYDKNISTSSSNGAVTASGATIVGNSSGNAIVTVTSNSNPGLQYKVRVIVLPASLYSAKTYSSVKSLGSISNSNMTLKYEIPVTEKIYITQSMAITQNYVIFNQINRANTQGKIRFVKKGEWKQVHQIDVMNALGHANGAAYNPNTRTLFVAPYTDEVSTPLKGYYCVSVDENTPTASVPVACSQESGSNITRLSYDKKLDLYYRSWSSAIKVMDSNFEQIDYYETKKRTTNQDIFGYNGILYMPNSTNYMDMYRLVDGAYLGSYTFSSNEVEDIDMFDEANNYLGILFYVSGEHKDKFYITNKLPIYK